LPYHTDITPKKPAITGRFDVASGIERPLPASGLDHSEGVKQAHGAADEYADWRDWTGGKASSREKSRIDGGAPAQTEQDGIRVYVQKGGSRLQAADVSVPQTRRVRNNGCNDYLL
jgi:hypothetical protein